MALFQGGTVMLPCMSRICLRVAPLIKCRWQRPLHHDSCLITRSNLKSSTKVHATNDYSINLTTLNNSSHSSSAYGCYRPSCKVGEIYITQKNRKMSTFSSWPNAVSQQYRFQPNCITSSSRPTTTSKTLRLCGYRKEQRRSAGHSKWANIKHTKAAKDGQRATMTLKFMRSVRVAIREGGSADPKGNNQLARTIEQAYKADVPKITIENTIKNAVKANENGSTVYFDAKGPGSFMLIIETFTNSYNRARMEVNSVFKKSGGQLSDKPISGHFFDYKGVVLATPGGSLPNLEAAEEAAIMADAEDVEETFDDDGNPVFQFICDEKAGHKVQKSLSEQYPDVVFNRPSFRYIAKIHTTLTGPTLEIAAKLVANLEVLDDVVRVYTNIQTKEES